MARRIESHMIPGPAGPLEALLEEPEEDEPREAALVCHPHPQHGGTMHNKVVYRLARGLRRAGCVVLRFNYRGVNLSAGAYAHGEGELEDALAALGWLRARYPELPYTLAGFSFGSRIVLRLGGRLPDVRRILAVGFPAAYRDTAGIETCERPKIFVHSTSDEYGSVEQITSVVETAPPPKTLHLVTAEDHFFKGALEEFENLIANVP